MPFENITGKLIKYERANIDTDLIIPARFLNMSKTEDLVAHCLEDLDQEFAIKKEKLNAEILVGGPNFGCGSSREHAPMVLKGVGLKCIIAPSFARIFLRNSINIGLPIIEFDKIEELSNGDEIDIDFVNGVMINKKNGKNYTISKMPEFLQELIDIGGLVNFAKMKIKKSI